MAIGPLDSQTLSSPAPQLISTVSQPLRHSALSTEPSFLMSDQHSALGTDHSALGPDLCDSALSTQHSAHSADHSALSTQHLDPATQMPSAVSTDHSALGSEENSALSTQHSALVAKSPSAKRKPAAIITDPKGLNPPGSKPKPKPSCSPQRAYRGRIATLVTRLDELLVKGPIKPTGGKKPVSKRPRNVIIKHCIHVISRIRLDQEVERILKRIETKNADPHRHRQQQRTTQGFGMSVGHQGLGGQQFGRPAVQHNVFAPQFGDVKPKLENSGFSNEAFGSSDFSAAGLRGHVTGAVTHNMSNMSNMQNNMQNMQSMQNNMQSMQSMQGFKQFDGPIAQHNSTSGGATFQGLDPVPSMFGVEGLGFGSSIPQSSGSQQPSFDSIGAQHHTSSFESNFSGAQAPSSTFSGAHNTSNFSGGQASNFSGAQPFNVEAKASFSNNLSFDFGHQGAPGQVGPGSLQVPAGMGGMADMKNNLFGPTSAPNPAQFGPSGYNFMNFQTQ